MRVSVCVLPHGGHSSRPILIKFSMELSQVTGQGIGWSISLISGRGCDSRPMFRDLVLTQTLSIMDTGHIYCVSWIREIKKVKSSMGRSP